MTAVKVELVRWIDDAQPGWVECRLVDAQGCTWLFHEKAPVVSAETLDAASPFPLPGALACREIERLERPEGTVVRVDTEHPWGVSATTGETVFEVSASALVE